MIPQRQIFKEVPIVFNMPPEPPAQIQTIEQEPTSSGPIKVNFKDYYKQNYKSREPDISKAVAAADNFEQKAANYIREHEGYRNELYRDHKKNWTIGIGHLVLPGEFEKFKGRVLSDAEIQSIFNRDMKLKIAAAQREFGKQFNEFSDNLKIAIIDGYFRGDLSGSPRTIELLKARRFKDAATEYLNHKEYKQSKIEGTGVAPRMLRNSKIMAAEK
jgi:GH24 family phage-related lysozyme (muramidase)